MYYRVKGFKIFKDRHGKFRCYHRASGDTIDLALYPLGSEGFQNQIAIIANKYITVTSRNGTLGALVKEWKKSPAFQNLKPKTREFYESALVFLKPLNEVSLLKIDPPAVAKIRDRAQEKKSWYFANQVKTTLSTLFAWAVERGHMASNPAKSIKKVKRPKDLARANRPWAPAERQAVLDAAAAHVKPLLAAMLYTGIDPCDAIALPVNKYKDGAIDLNRQKTGNPVWKPLPRALKVIIGSMPKHNSITLFANSYGKPWTKSGFDSVWHKLKAELVKNGLISKGLTLKGLRHTHATMLREQGESDRTIADALGDKSESMGRWYSRDADNKESMTKVIKAFDKRHKNVKPSKNSVKP